MALKKFRTGLETRLKMLRGLCIIQKVGKGTLLQYVFLRVVYWRTSYI